MKLRPSPRTRLPKFPTPKLTWRPDSKKCRFLQAVFILYLLLEHKLFINLYVFIIENGTKINNKMGK